MYVECMYVHIIIFNLYSNRGFTLQLRVSIPNAGHDLVGVAWEGDAHLLKVVFRQLHAAVQLV